ncbi:MAG: NAD-dependent epimerase/dehydratase family protein [Chloroflexi bacterium]|nr:NAD-dependent epimerase/dehydratase family protein [Chloroflexota bacterium]
MRCLVTGGAGFIGAALTNRLVRDGHHVRVLDDLSAGDPARVHPDALFTRGDVRDRPKLWTLLQGVDCVFHLAARVSVQESVLYPREYNDVNVGGTVSLVEAIRDVGVKRVVLASSATVYGPQDVQPVREDYWPHPLVPYAVSKLAAEYYIFALGELNNIETVALRIFNAYGPGQRMPPAHAPVAPLFVKNVLSGASVVVHGDGSQTRDFVYIDDVVNALIAAATAPDVNRAVINVGSGQETSIQQLIAAVGQVTRRQPEVIHNRQQSGGSDRLVADLTRARQLLGYQPKVTLKEGLRRLLDEDPRFSRKLEAGK